MVINNELSRKSGKGKGTILIVDDIPENLRILNSILSENGYHVRPALNGQLALNSAQVDIPDMVLMDIKMPGMDGYETCAHLKDDERTKEVPVIFVSALQDVTDKVKCFKLGAVDYITKPFEIREILARVENQMTILNLQRELKARNKELEKTVKIREEVENIICHDLKGPLSPILSYPRMIRKKGPLTDKQSQYLRKIDLAGHKLLGIITLTNDLFKMEKGIYNFEPEPINLVTVIDTIVSEFSHIADQKDLSIQVLMNGQVIKERENKINLDRRKKI